MICKPLPDILIRVEKGRGISRQARRASAITDNDKPTSKGDNTMDNENTNDIDLATLPAWKCVEILTKRPEQADKCDRQRMREELGG